MPPDSSPLTQLLADAQLGDKDVEDRLIQLSDEELHRRARGARSDWQDVRAWSTRRLEDGQG